MSTRERRTDFELFDFWYQNEHKVDALFSGLSGRLETERKESVSKGVGGTGKLGLELGGLLAAIGLAKGTAEGELRSDYEKILEVTSSLSVENKIGLLLAHLREQGELAELEVDRLSADALVAGIRGSRFQLLLGEYVWFTDGDDRYELRSSRQREDGEGPLVRVPLLADNMTPNQATQVMFWDEGDGKVEAWPHEVFAHCIVRDGWVLANPVAIWLPDQDDPAGAWSTGDPIVASS